MTWQELRRSSARASLLLVLVMVPFATCLRVWAPEHVTIRIDADPIQLGRPYGVAVSSAGVAYVTLLDFDKLVRFKSAGDSVPIRDIAVGDKPTGVAFTPDGAEAYVASQDGKIDVVRTANDSVVATVLLPGAAFNAAVSPDGKRAYLGSNRFRVYVIATDRRSLVDSLVAGPSPNAFAFTPSGDRLFYTDYVDGRLRQALVATNVPAASTALYGGGQGVALSRTGDRLFLARERAGDVLVVDPVTGVPLDSIRVPGGMPFGLVRRPRTDLLWVTTLQGRIVVIDPRARRVVGDTFAGGILRRLAFDSAGAHGVIADEAGRVLFVH